MCGVCAQAYLVCGGDYSNDEDLNIYFTIDRYNDDTRLTAGVCHEDGTMVSRVYVPIEYCPFCGRKLVE